MSARPRLACWLALAASVFLLLPATLPAQTQARMHGVVSDENGQPLAGVQITVTRGDLAAYKLELKTDKNGKYTLTLQDATKVHTIKLVKEGYQTIEGPKKVGVGANDETNFTLRSVKSLIAAGAVTNPAVALFNEAANFFNLGDYEAAQAKFEEAAAADPTLAAPHSALARLWLVQKEYAKAQAAAEKALGLDAKEAKALLVLWEAARSQGDEAKAADALARLRQSDPKGAAEALYVLGAQAFDAGRADEAAKVLADAVQLDPTHPRARYRLGMALINTGDSAGAKIHLTKFVELAPDDPEVATAQEMLKYLK